MHFYRCPPLQKKRVKSNKMYWKWSYGWIGFEPEKPNFVFLFWVLASRFLLALCGFRRTPLAATLIFYRRIVFVRCVFVFGHVKTILRRDYRLIDPRMRAGKVGHCYLELRAMVPPQIFTDWNNTEMFHIRAEIKSEKSVWNYDFILKVILS